MVALISFNKDACSRNKIDPDSLITGAVMGRVILYDVKFYDSKHLFLKHRNKHRAGKVILVPNMDFY